MGGSVGKPPQPRTSLRSGKNTAAAGLPPCSSRTEGPFWPMLSQNHLEILGPPASIRAELTRCPGIADAKKVREPESGAACLVPKPTECDFHFVPAEGVGRGGT